MLPKRTNVYKQTNAFHFISPTNAGIKAPIYRLFFDHSLFTNYQWNTRRKLKIRNGLGFSINNLNSSFSFWRNDGSDSVFVQDNFRFSTFDLPMDSTEQISTNVHPILFAQKSLSHSSAAIFIIECRCAVQFHCKI